MVVRVERFPMRQPLVANLFDYGDDFASLCENFFSTPSVRSIQNSPAADVAENESEFVVKIELPGVPKDDIRITMQDNVLTVAGEKKHEKESKGSDYHRTELSYGAFQRSFTLPAIVKADNIEASYNDGILQITLPKAEEAKPKQIEVKVK